MSIEQQIMVSGPDFRTFRAGEPGFDDEVAGFQAGYHHAPDLVVAAGNAQDVRAAVEYAAAQGLPVAVQATGHGLSVAADRGVLISTRRMTDIVIDARARTARIGAGVQAVALIEAAAAHGLAPLNGSSPLVGVVGYTLGGGMGIMARTFGYAADHVRSIEIVTADGVLRTLNPDDELFSAVLGSGGNFGVVTALELDLVPVTHLYGGQLVFDAPLVETAVQTWKKWTADLPDEMTSTVIVMTFPNIPQVPAPVRGRYVASFRIAYTGSPEEGERLVAPLRAIGERLTDNLRSMPYTDTHTIHSDPDFPHAYTATNALLRDLPSTSITDLLQKTGPESPVGCVVDIRHLGGALRRAGASSVDFREADYVVRVISMPQPDTADKVRAHHALVRETLAEHTLGHNLNFLYADGLAADEAQTQGGYTPATYARLATLKAAHDPTNMFRFNRNIRPAN